MSKREHAATVFSLCGQGNEAPVRSAISHTGARRTRNSKSIRSQELRVVRLRERGSESATGRIGTVTATADWSSADSELESPLTIHDSEDADEPTRIVPGQEPFESAAGSPRMFLPLIPLSDLDIKKELGKGSFGEVQLAWWASRGKDVAVKANGIHCASTDAIDNETRLLEVLMRYPHRNVVKVLGVCIDAPDGNVRLVMEYCSGGSLDSYLSRVRESGMVSLGSSETTVFGALIAKHGPT